MVILALAPLFVFSAFLLRVWGGGAAARRTWLFLKYRFLSSRGEEVSKRVLTAQLGGTEPKKVFSWGFGEEYF